MIYVVKMGDTVDMIAAQTGVAVQRIIRDNQLLYPYELAVGQALFIAGEQTDQLPKRGRKFVCGYAYPFISTWVLEQTLDYLTELNIFSYGFTPQGDLVYPVLADEPLIRRAWNHGTRPILTLTPLDAEGRFNNLIIHEMIRNPVSLQSLIDNLAAVCLEKGYAGVDVDFEYILAEDRDYFTQFVAELTRQLNENNLSVSVALAPKTSSEQTGLLYEGKDYAGLGQVANHVFLMTYEWGYTYGPPMAVAPLNKVEQVVQYALTQIDKDKIVMGIPNYGYDWPLPFMRGETKATTIGNVEAVTIAVENGAWIQFDEIAQSPFFEYWKDEPPVQHEVWFEDVRSLRQKFQLVEKYDLMGCGYWTVMQWFLANWLQLSETFYSGEEFPE